MLKSTLKRFSEPLADQIEFSLVHLLSCLREFEKRNDLGRLKDSIFFQEAIHEINYPFGDFYLFDGFVIAEVYEGVTFTWDNHGKKVVEDIAYLYDTNGHDLILISNRINPYSTKPTDWKKFFKHRYTLKGYAVVTYSKMGNSIALLERLFIRTKSKRFSTLENAIEWAQGASGSRMVS